ncbi:MAG: hypothetical protein LC641_13160 [Spirochaeta sp.]|nr:hypothetical protein [Spirochaeta sp.]
MQINPIQSRSLLPAHRAQVLVVVLILMVCGMEAYGRGTPEDSWEPVSGSEVWQHEFDLSELSPGTHNVVVRARDRAGNESVGGPFNIRIDPEVTLPSVRIVYPDENAVLRDSFSMIGVADSFFALNRVEISVDSESFSSADGTAYWGGVVDIDDIPDGPITLYARAVDAQGQVGSASSIATILDREAPSVSIDSHQTGAIVSGNVRVEGRADDANGIDTLELSVDGGESYEPLRVRRSRGATEVSFSFSIQTRSLEDGPLSHNIRATDTTGATTDAPVFLYVDNQAPELELVSPEEDDLLSGIVQFTGRVSDTIGIERLFYEWDREEYEIDLRPGDPYWTTLLDLRDRTGSSFTVRFTAVDRSGNSTSVTRRINHDVDNRLPQVVLVHPDEDTYRELAVDTAFFGEVTGAGRPEAVIVEGEVEREYPARPGFRIPTADLPLGRSDLRIRGRFADGTEGSPIRIRIERVSELEEARVPEQSRVLLSNVSAYDYLNDMTLVLEGGIPDYVPGQRLQYRLQPNESWNTLPVAEGAFSVNIALSGRAAGTLHLELRTATGAVADLPVYIPLNYVPDAPELRVSTPRATDSINGITTVAGTVQSGAPIREFVYSINEETRIPVDIDLSPSGGSFVFPVDFTQLVEDGGRLTIQVTDEAGNTSIVNPVYQVDIERDFPTVQILEPQDGVVVMDGIVLSGLALDDDAVTAVHWRIGDGEFNRVSTDQSFRIDLSLDSFEPGEQRIEVFAEDIYGLRGDVVSVDVQVSTDRPEIAVLEPGANEHMQGALVIRGAASDINGIESVLVSMDNGNTFQRAEGTEEWSLNLNSSAYQDGTYSILIIATDSLGVESRATSLINIDNTAPSLSLVRPYDGQVVDGTLQLSGGVEDNIQMQRLTLQIASHLADESEVFETEIESRVVLQDEIDVSAFAPGSYSLSLKPTLLNSLRLCRGPPWCRRLLLQGELAPLSCQLRFSSTTANR